MPGTEGPQQCAVLLLLLPSLSAHHPISPHRQCDPCLHSSLCLLPTMPRSLPPQSISPAFPPIQTQLLWNQLESVLVHADFPAPRILFSLSLSPLHPEAFTCRSLSSHHWFGDQSLCLLMTLLHVCILVSQGARQDGAFCTPASRRASAAPDTREVPQKEPNSGGAIQWPSAWSSVSTAHVIHRTLRGHRCSGPV